MRMYKGDLCSARDVFYGPILAVFQQSPLRDKRVRQETFSPYRPGEVHRACRLDRTLNLFSFVEQLSLKVLISDIPEHQLKSSDPLHIVLPTS
jgi:hypothetical protein